MLRVSISRVHLEFNKQPQEDLEGILHPHIVSQIRTCKYMRVHTFKHMQFFHM